MVNENLGNELYVKFNDVLNDIAVLPVGGPLGWLYVWDCIRDVVMDIEISVDGDTTYGDWVMVPGVDLKAVWDTLWENPWGGFDIDGSDVVDWLSAKGLIQEWESEEQELEGEVWQA
jgi:hypothetical protein